MSRGSKVPISYEYITYPCYLSTFSVVCVVGEAARFYGD